MVALVVADAVVEKFGGDSVTEVRRNVTGYLATLADTRPIPADPATAGSAAAAS